MGNQQPVFNRLEVPSFGLAWLNIDDSTGESFVLIPGGGGSTKSGVKNQIQIGRNIHDKRGGFEFLKKFETDVDGKSVLCSGVAVGTCMGLKIVCAFLDNHCAILTVEKKGDDLLLKRVADFKADFSDDGSVNCACILPSGHIVTGGDDGICRLWAVGFTDKDSDKPAVWRVRMLNMMKGHTAAIMDISHHPDDALISTAAKDGSCKIWNVVNGIMVCDVPSILGLPGSGVAHKQNSKLSVGPIKMECRGCCFSADGNYLYAIQSARRGATHLVEWQVNQYNDEKESTNSVSTGSSDNTDLRTKVSVSMHRTKSVSKFPCTRLKISDGGEFLAVGASDGTVSLINSETFKTVSVSACHDLPATGLGFAPSSTAQSIGLQEILVSCSADNRLVMIKIEKAGMSTLFKLCFVIISFAFFLALLAFAAILFSIELPPLLSSLFTHTEL